MWYPRRMAGKISLVLLLCALALGVNAGVVRAGGVFEDTNAAIIYSSGWTAVSGGAYSGASSGTLHLTETTGATGATASLFCTNSSAFDVLISTASNRGYINIYLDGTLVGSYIDAYSSTTTRQVWAFGGGYYISPGNHTITVQALHQKNALSSGYWADLDRIDC